MNCDDLQQSLLQDAELGSEVASHLAGCRACAVFEENLLSLDRGVRGLPGAPGADAARVRFLAKLSQRQGMPSSMRIAPVAESPTLTAGGPRRARPYRWAVAATLFIAAGAAEITFLHRTSAPVTRTARVTTPQTEAQSTSLKKAGVAATPALPETAGQAAGLELVASTDAALLTQLVSHNLALAEIPSTNQRQVVYDGDAPLRQKVRAAPLSATDRKVAETLLGDGAWISQHDDPLAAADRFTCLADLLVDRMNATGDTPAAISELSQTYGMVLDRGIYQNLDRAGAVGNLSAERQGRFARIIQNHERVQRRLDALIEKYPNANKQAIRQALETARQLHRKRLLAPQSAPTGAR